MLKDKFKKLSIRSKFFFSMFLSSALIFLIVMAANNLVFIDYFAKSESQSSANELDAVAQQLDFFLTSVENYSNTIKLDSDVQTVCHEYNREKDNFTYNLTGYAKDQLNTIIQSTKFIHSVSIYSTDYRLLISTETVPMNQHPDIFDGLTNPCWISTLKHSRLDPLQTIHTISYFCVFYSYSTGEKLGYIEIAIPESAISNTYQNHLSPTTDISIVNHSGIIESDVDEDKIGLIYGRLPENPSEQPFTRSFLPQAVVFSHNYQRLGWYIIKEVQYSSFFASLGSTFLISLSISLLCLLLYLFLAKKISATITTPLHKLISHTKIVGRGEWKTIDAGIANDQDTQTLLNSFNRMIVTQETLKNELIAAQNEKTKLSLDLLQEQINPHFLYNTLENICSLAEIGENKILIEIVMNLSSFYRSCLSNGKLIISLAEEIDITRAYLKIMQIRNFNNFDFSIDCEEELLTCPCLKLLLQPVVENSIEHGISESVSRGMIEIKASRSQDMIILTVKDNGGGIHPDKLKATKEVRDNHFGLYNVERRIQLYYGTDCGLTLENNCDGGCTTTLRLKMEVPKDANIQTPDC